MPTNYSIALNQDILKDLGNRLRQQRLNNNQTVARLATISGVSARTISGFERGETNLSLVNLIELLRALHLLDRLADLIPDLPLVTPIELAEIQKQRKKRAK